MLPIKEKDIEKYIRDLLAWDGWTVRKMEQNYSERKRKRVGEAGMADLLAIRYRLGYGSMTLPYPFDQGQAAEVLWIETKRPKGKTAQAQYDWHARERERGAKTLMLTGGECEASPEGFKRWYAESGLQRRT